MTTECLFLTARCAVFALRDGGYYATKRAYRLVLNGEEHGLAERVVTSLYGLLPDTDYRLQVLEGDQLLATAAFHTKREAYTLNVRRFGAVGDGVHDDTAAIQAAILACPEESRVLLPKGRYSVTPLFLKSHLRMELAQGAELLLAPDRSRFPVLPGLIESTDEQTEENLGTWEGNPLDCYAALLTGLYVEDAVVYGQGLLDGQAQKGDWWKEPKKKRGAWRGRLCFLNGCKGVVIQGLTFQNSPSWNLHPYFSENLGFYDIKVLAPADSPNTDGFDPESCKNLRLAGARFSLGDDCIAIKSGKLYMGQTRRTPCQGLEVMHCLMENGHGGVTIGSEMAGGVKDVYVHHCEMRNTDRGLRIKTRRGRGENGVIDGIRFAYLSMKGVKAPLTLNAMYHCDPDGHTAYVSSREALPVDHRTPVIGDLSFTQLQAEDCEACAGYFLGLPEQKIKSVTIQHSCFSFAGQGQPMAPVMADGVEPCRKRGLYAANLHRLVLRDVRMSGQEGEALRCENVDVTEGGIAP